jgi:anti-sigma regulatory factor (Ser/Thr protein kinase)
MTEREQSGLGDLAATTPSGDAATRLLAESFTADSVTALRHAVLAAIGSAGLSGPRADDFALAVHELMTNAVRHGGGSGRLELRLLADVVTCEVIDQGGGADGLPVRLVPADQPGGRGLWLAHQLAGSLMLVRRPDGVTASVSVCVSQTPAGVQHPPPAGQPEH